MVYPDELHLSKFRQLFLVALKTQGVTAIGTFSVQVVTGVNEVNDVPWKRMDFTLHTNVGIKSYSMSMSLVGQFNGMVPDEADWENVIVNPNYETEVITITFFNAEKTVLEIFPQVTPQGTAENV